MDTPWYILNSEAWTWTWTWTWTWGRCSQITWYWGIWRYDGSDSSEKYCRFIAVSLPSLLSYAGAILEDPGREAINYETPTRNGCNGVSWGGFVFGIQKRKRWRDWSVFNFGVYILSKCREVGRITNFDIVIQVNIKAGVHGNGERE